MRLDQRVAIVTGGSSGIGREVCLDFARSGALVVVADIQEAPKQGIYHEQDTTTTTVQEVENVGGRSLFVQTDVASEKDVERLVAAAVEEFGGLDIVVNNAGIYIPGDSQDLSTHDWDRVVGVDFRSVFLLTKYSVPHLKRSQAGRIINIGSVHSFRGGAGPAYAPVKAAVVNLTRDSATELAGHGVTVNAICPGYIETAIQDYLTPEQIAGARDRTPLPRLGLPSDIAHACTFLASDHAEWITGIALPVDGGWLAPIM